MFDLMVRWDQDQANLQLKHDGLPYSNHVANDDRCQGCGGYPPRWGGYHPDWVGYSPSWGIHRVGIPLTVVGVALPDDIMLWQMPHSHMPTI